MLYLQNPSRLDEADGAGERNRTPDLLITKQLLYRLSYTGTVRRPF